MKKILLALFSVTLLSFSVKAQFVDSLVSNLMINLEEEKWDKVVELFHQFAEQDPENAEVFYWVKGADKKLIADSLSYTLAEVYHKRGELDKSLSFYKLYISKANCSVEELLVLAQVIIDLCDVRLTQQIYERVIELDPKNVTANIFLGNYIYLRAERERKRLDYQFKKIKKPTRMEYARYRQQLKDLYLFSYVHAKTHLEEAYKSLKSVEVEKTLSHIDDIRKEAI
ncbi:hypothetical protein [Bacteroides sp.]|uniref:tetratricopeptide repeat protein n=1 Tax=Bacteroides sp. TaxID=29523 RepID=UPI00259129CF|nr:hypothetical protein [Bacteroides sp.]